MAKYLSSLLVSRTEPNDDIPLILPHSEDFDLEVEDETLVLKIYRLVRQNRCWLYVWVHLRIHLNAHVSFVVEWCCGASVCT
jgi:hypothetical protein